VARFLSFLAPGEEPRLLELLPDGEIGAGRGPAVMNWHWVESREDVDLIFSDAFGPRWRLAPAGPGRWAGGSVREESVPAFAAVGSLVPSRAPPARFADLWTQWPRPGHYQPSDDGQL
jgi:hypothetical protein